MNSARCALSSLSPAQNHQDNAPTTHTHTRQTHTPNTRATPARQRVSDAALGPQCCSASCPMHRLHTLPLFLRLLVWVLITDQKRGPTPPFLLLRGKRTRLTRLEETRGIMVGASLTYSTVLTVPCSIRMTAAAAARWIFVSPPCLQPENLGIGIPPECSLQVVKGPRRSPYVWGP